MGHKSFLLRKERKWEFSEKSDGAEFNGLFIEAAFLFFFVNLVYGVTGNISHSVLRKILWQRRENFHNNNKRIIVFEGFFSCLFLLAVTGL